MEDLLAVMCITIFSFVLSLVLYIAFKYEVKEEAVLKFYDIYTGPIEEKKMNRTDKEIPGYIQRMIEEKNELAERKNKLSAFIESGKAIELSSADYMDLLLQLNAMEEYHLILERRLNRAFNKEGIA